MTGTSAESLAARIDDLETRAAFQERTIEELNDMIAAQWKQIDRLSRQYDRLKAEMEESLQSRAGPPSIEPPPPHY